MNFKYFFYKLIRNQIRQMSNKSKSKNHYNSLGITSNSTQNEVKSAYYKLSMLYHPDKNQNNPESSQKFRDITEAYEVLGNTKTRRLYDKGLYFRDTVVVDDAINKFHKSRETKSKPPPPTGRTPIYDFDEWSKNHYGSTFQRVMESKKRKEFLRMKKEQDLNDIKMEKMLFVIGVVFVICMWVFKADTEDYDKVTYVSSMPIFTKKTKKETESD